MENFKYFGSNGEEGILYVDDRLFRTPYGKIEKGQSLKEWQQQRIRKKAFLKKLTELFSN